MARDKKFSKEKWLEDSLKEASRNERTYEEKIEMTKAIIVSSNRWVTDFDKKSLKQIRKFLIKLNGADDKDIDYILKMLETQLEDWFI